MKARIHATAGVLALSTVATFWLSTVVSELLLSPATVAWVKQAILYGMFVLIPAMAATGASGFALARARRGRLVERKQRRMILIALNGLLVMLPSAYFLARRAAQGEFDSLFYAVQGLELAVGLLQLYLLGSNFRDGLRLRRR